MRHLAPVLMLAVCAAAAHAAEPAVEVSQAWSRPAAAGGVGAGFMTLSNPTRKADALVAVESPIARTVEMHRSTQQGGVATMGRVSRIEAPAGGNVTLAPGGYHLMFVGLAKPLKAGESFPATLVFASGARVRVTFRVGVAAPAAEHARH
jgi:periplasmic copper chaperone A